MVPAGLLGCDGSTLTVRLYSAVRPERISTVQCDTDSHTSVVLLQILLKELYGVVPVVSDWVGRGGDWPEALMLIGDKVVTDSPPAARYPHQLDLGAAWTEMSGLPFVFAIWMAKRRTDPAVIATAAAILDRQRRHNLQRLDLIVHRRAEPTGWPRAVAGDYLKHKLAFEFTGARRRGLELFFDKACELGLVKRRRPLEIRI